MKATSFNRHHRRGPVGHNQPRLRGFGGKLEPVTEVRVGDGVARRSPREDYLDLVDDFRDVADTECQLNPMASRNTIRRTRETQGWSLSQSRCK
jgi:hypothetical protein